MAEELMEVLVVGGGPVGLTMAAELARHGVRCRIIDKLAVPSGYCKAIGVTPRTPEVWDDMGIAREMIDAVVVCAMARLAAFHGKHSNGHESDYRTIIRLTKGNNELEDALWQYTCDLAHQYRDVIEILAIILREKKHLNGKLMDDLTGLLLKRKPRQAHHTDAGGHHSRSSAHDFASYP
jgi:2-polyprenyl-6-methoxyphenol hydroxylase-like FAD-dependent oxidoreductase